jgi:hypothetical protein
MRIIETKVYKFEELQDQAKQQVLEKFCSINVDFNWWDDVYYDAEQVGIKICGFDIDRYCRIELYDTAKEVAEKIVKNHGKVCETYKTAKQFLDDIENINTKYGEVTEDNEYDYEKEMDELSDDFIKDIAEDYLGVLKTDYEYRTSEEAIIEFIEANDYEFTEDGGII